MNSFWSGWITVIVIVNLLGCLWLLWWTRKRPDDSVGLGESMGHSFDGIEEINNPLPKWWLNLFYMTLVFAAGYLALYPGLGNFSGLLNWTSTSQLETELAKADNRYGAIFREYAAMPVEEIIQDPEALAIGQRLFGNNCAVCHGSDARGATGFPNLTDNDWLYGGTPEKIKETLLLGRNSIGMPAYIGMAGKDGVRDLAAYVLSLSGRRDAGGNADNGKALFLSKGCVACHGLDAKGNPMMGAPNLTDDIWLYGGTEEDILTTLAKGRKGVMPAFKDKLGEDRIHVLAAYVYSLSQPVDKASP